jgi:hypothetical protein
MWLERRVLRTINHCNYVKHVHIIRSKEDAIVARARDFHPSRAADLLLRTRASFIPATIFREMHDSSVYIFFADRHSRVRERYLLACFPRD